MFAPAWGGAYDLEGLRDGAEMAPENVFYTDDPNSFQHTGIILDADTRDLGHVGRTNILRASLPLCRQVSNDQYIHYEPGVWGRHRIDALLLWPLNMYRFMPTGAVAAEKKVPAMILGRIMPNRIYPPQLTGYAGSITTPGLTGTLYEFAVKSQLNKRFTWQNRLATPNCPFLETVHIGGATAAVTLTSDDIGFCFTNAGNSGDLTVTLPALQKGLFFYFYSIAGGAIGLASPEGDNFVAMNDSAADTVTFGTAGEIIGGGVMAYCDGTRWLLFPHVWDGQTVTAVS